MTTDEYLESGNPEARVQRSDAAPVIAIRFISAQLVKISG